VEAHRALKAAGAAPMLTKREVAALRGVSQSTIDRMVRRGEFPPGEMVSPRKRGWRLSVVQAVPAAAPSPSQARKDGRFARDAA
jgi:predicted DNA-binding transcriptional regulator AlpA